MHKRNSKLSQKELRHSSTSRRSHLKNRDTDEGTLEIIKAPQNSRNELSKKLEFGNEEVEEKLKSSKGKHKHKGQKSKSNERNNKKKSVHNIQDVALVKESGKHKEKKEKRDKERLNKIEKYLEGLHKVSSKILLHGRSLSLDSSKALLANQDKQVRKEKTFHDKTSKDVSTNSHLNILDSKHQSTEKSHTRKKHRHKENKNRESSKDKNTKDNQQSVLYCEVELQSPFLQETKKYNVERLYPEASKETYSRIRSSSRDNSVPSRFEHTLASRRDKIKRTRDKNTIPAKFSARKSKVKVDLRNHNDQRSNVSLGLYGKYFTFDKTSQNEKETTRKKKKKRRKSDSTTNLSRNRKKIESKEENIKPEKVKKNQEKTGSSPDQYKVRIEDDIKSYFSKIQTLIDKKLDFILGSGTNSKDVKSNLLEKENSTHKSKDKRVEKRDRNHPRRERKRSVEEEKLGRNLEEEARTEYSEEEIKTARESRRVKDTEASKACLKRERYPSEDSRYCRRRHSPQPPRYHHEHRSLSPPHAKQGSDTDVKHHKRHTSPSTRYSSHRMNPDHLIKMLEHPSTFSVKSSTSLLKKRLEEVKRRPNDIQTAPDEAEHYQKRDRSLSKRNISTNEDNLKVEDLEKLHTQEVRKLKKRVAATQSNTVSNKEKPDDIYSELNGKEHRCKRDGRCTTVPGEDDFDEMDLLEASNKKTKKRMRQLNLECKTVSIVGIPSQIRESTIFNETQTTTSLNVINPAEDSVEQKKKSKRFKLYYKYSVADNKCPHESDKSSEGMKSIVSDSYRVVSDPSDNNVEIWEDKDANKDSDSDVSKILFIMKNEKVQKTKKYRKRAASPKPVTLNNIVEEPSNISIAVRSKENKSSLKKDLNCTFFKSLRSSSSGCNLDSIKHSRKDPNKRKSRNPFKENSIKSKSPRDISTEQENKKYEETHRYGKHVTTENRHGVKKRNTNTNYASKSDINISYDSLKNRKTTKSKYKDDGPNHFREQLRQILPDIIFPKSNPDRKSIDMIIKEEIREIIREIPRKVIRELSFAEEPDKIVSKFDHQPSLKKSNEIKKQDVAEQTYCFDKINDTHEENSNERFEKQDAEVECHKQDSKQSNCNPDMQNIEEDKYCSKKTTDSHEVDSKIEDIGNKTFCSKKIGTNHAVTRIPSLIKGYTSMTSSEVKGESMEVHNLVDHTNQEESDYTMEELGKNLVDAATEINIAGNVTDKAVIMLENKKSQTPSYLDTPTVVTVCDVTKQYQYSKKVATTNNVKRCKIVDPFVDGKIGSVSKIARPIINLENSQFPGCKPDRSATPVSEQNKREKSNLSEEKTVKFESMEKLEPRKLSGRRPATAGEKRKDSPSDKFRQKFTKPALTMSTNIAVIDTSRWAEVSETYNTQTKRSRKDLKNYPDQRKPLETYTLTTFKNQIQSNLRSKSSMGLNDTDVESKVGSLVYVDKYNNQKMNLNSNSNSRSLDTCTTKCLINDNPHPSKLFLTKSFDPKLNTYQRRKMYDENIRKKMKKKFGTKNQMGPRIFEVRYLTLESPSLQEEFDINSSSTAIINHKCISRLPTYNIKTNKVKLRSRSCKPSIKMRRFPKNKEDACKFSGRDIFAPVISDVDQLNKFRRKTFPEKKVKEIFVKGRSLTEKTSASDREQNSSTRLRNNEQICKMDQGNSEYVHQNFKTLVDQLYNSIISYCDTKFKLPQESSPGPNQIINNKQNISKSPVDEKSYIIFPKPSNETISTLNESFKKNSCSEGNITAEEKDVKPPANLICSHLSCPVLAGSTSSFDYLYEDGPIEINKDAVLLHFKKPMKTILGYALNNTHRVQKQTFRHRRKGYRAPNSVTDSEESGYSSNNSKKCASVCSFFKKPSIINLFKPLRKLETEMSTSTLNDCRSGPNLQEYSVMNQKCIEYAEKVRNQCENNQKPAETFREIPLDVLLLCKKSYTFLGDFNSNCSLCKKYSTSELPNITETDELSNKMDNLDHLMEDNDFTEEDKHTDALQEGNIQKETLIFYEDVGRKPSLEVVTLQKSHTSFIADDSSQLVKEIVQCPVVLSITNLNPCSLTIVEEPNANKTGFCFENIQKEGARSIDLDLVHLDPSNFKESHVSKSSIHMEIDGKSDIFFGIGSRYSSTPSAASKFMAKRFFENLLKVYEKEIDMTNKLFQDDHFFVNVLLESVKSKPKNKLKKFIKEKIKNCIGNLFFSKNCADNGCVGSNETSNSNNNQRQLQSLAGDARKYFCMFVQAVKTNKDINDEIKICGLLKLLERIEDGDFAILRKKEEVDFENEIKKQVKEAFMNIYQMSVKEARKHKRSLTTEDLKLIRTFVSKYRIGMLSKTDLIATYIGRGVFKTEGHLKAAVNYLIRQNKAKDVDLKDFDEHCKILSKC